jgi:hypothetical protein
VCSSVKKNLHHPHWLSWALTCHTKAFKEVHLWLVTCNVFTKLYGKAYIMSFTPQLVKKAFKATSIVPFNLDTIWPKQMRLSEVTAGKSLFPLTLPSPVPCVMMAMCAYKSTAIELLPSTHAVHGGNYLPNMVLSLSASPKHRLRALILLMKLL